MKRIFLVCMFLCLPLFVNAEDKVIVIKNLDGTVSVVHRVNKSKTIEQIYERLVEADPSLVGLEHIYINVSDLPASREDRNAWELSGGKVKVNQSKATAKRQAKQKKIDDKVSGKNKLKALGLTQDEIDVLTK